MLYRFYTDIGLIRTIVKSGLSIVDKFNISCMVRGFFRPAPFFWAFPLYRNSAARNKAETRDTIYTEDNKSKDSIIYFDCI